uniref:Calponin-homology (CH) domain-containing protein n=1 Tax=Macrostomum lignano TaxID=282301 RepID=A0A1I8I4D0_9PLAT
MYCMVEHFNSLLKVSVFSRIYEGVLLCALANLLKPNFVDEKSVVVKEELLDNSADGELRKMENRNIGITALRTLGVYMDSETAEWIKMDTPFEMTGLLVQVLRLATVGRMHFQNFEILVHLFDGWSEPEEAISILATEREQMLIIWLNAQISAAGMKVTAFDDNLADSKAYSTLLWTVAPEAQRASLTSTEDVMKETDLTKRAELVIANAEKLGISGILRPEHITEIGKKAISDPKGLHNIIINMAFVYRIFVAYPNINAPKMKDKPAAGPKTSAAPTHEQRIQESCKYGASEETLIRWLNSFGPSSPVVSLRTDLCNGRVLLEVWDAMIPGSVPWKQVKLQQFVNTARRKFSMISNCDIAVKIGDKNGISKNVCSSGNITAGETKYIASFVFLMMRLHAQLLRKGIIGGPKKVAELDDNGLTKWFNESMEKYGSTFRLKSLEDPSLKSTNALGYFGERVLVENNLCSSGPADFPRKPKATAKSANAIDISLADADDETAAQDEAQQQQSDANNSGEGAWLFNSVEQVSSDPALLTKFSVTAILMFNKAGVIVYASKLGPETDLSHSSNIMSITKGYINGKFIMVIDIESRKEDEQAKAQPQPLTETSVREKYAYDMYCMVEHFNSLLKGNSLAAGFLPLTEVSVFSRIYEGVLLCALANLLKPNFVDEKSVVVKEELLDNSADGELRKMENRNIGITALRTLGVYMDSETAEWIKMDTPFEMTGLLVQVLRLATVGRMHFQNFEILVHLFDGWSEPEEAGLILATDRETMLLIWINYQLKKAGSDIKLADLGESLADSKVYSTLLWTVAPEAQRASLTSAKDIMKETDLTKRAELVIANAEKLGISGVLRPEHIATAGKLGISNSKGLHNIVLNMAFFYRIFAAYPNIDVPKMKDKPAGKEAASTPEQQVQESCKYGVSEETLIRWLNSFGPSSPVVSLQTDLRNGRVLLEVWDAMFPGSVPWKKVKLEHFEMFARRKFNWIANCDIAISIGEKHGISKNVCSSGNIAAGETKYIASMVFLMMRLHSQLTRQRAIGGSKKVAELDNQSLVKWFNESMEKYGSAFRLKTLEDPSLKSTNALGYFGERVLVENNLCSSGPADFPRKPKATAKSANAIDISLADADEETAAQDEAQQQQSDANNSGEGAWLFNSVEQVSSDPALLTKFSVTAILMFNKAGVIVYASKLGPETDLSIFINSESEQSKPIPISETIVRKQFGFDMVCMVEHFNRVLKDITLATSCVPLTEVSIFYKAYEGILLCALANLLKPDSVDEKTITLKPELLDDSPDGELRKIENRNIGITALRSQGSAAMVNIHVPSTIAAILVQVLRRVTLGRMHFQSFEVAILATDREKMLLIWINHLLKKASTDLQLTNLGANLADSKVYSILLWTVAPEAQRASLTSSEDVMKETDLTKRAELVVANAEKLGITGILRPEHIVKVGKDSAITFVGLKNIVLNLAFLFRIFVAYPNIDVPKMKDLPSAASKKAAAVAPMQQVSSLGKHGATEDSLIRWLNSFGPSSPVVSLKTDLCNGRVLLEVWDAMFPGCVPWNKVKLEEVNLSSRRKFTWMANCDIAIGIGQKHGITRDVCSSGNISTGEVKYIASMVFLMMRLHAQLTRKEIIGEDSKVADLDDKGLVKWFNEMMEKYRSDFRLKSVDDPNLKNTNALGYFGERILVENNLLSSGPADFPRKPKVAEAAKKPAAAAGAAGKRTPPPVAPKPKMPAKMPPKSKNAADSNAEEDDGANNEEPAATNDDNGEEEEQQTPAEAHNSGGGAWQFNSVEQVSSDPALLTTFSVTAILMFSKAGVIVYASKLGPETDAAVYRSVLMELNGLSMKTCN